LFIISQSHVRHDKRGVSISILANMLM